MLRRRHGVAGRGAGRVTARDWRWIATGSNGCPIGIAALVGAWCIACISVRGVIGLDHHPVARMWTVTARVPIILHVMRSPTVRRRLTTVDEAKTEGTGTTEVDGFRLRWPRPKTALGMVHRQTTVRMANVVGTCTTATTGRSEEERMRVNN